MDVLKRTTDSTLALQNELYQLRQETLDAFNQAKSLEVKWQDLDRQQKEQHQV
jgi:ESCRT-I complex subunit VPS37